MKDSLDPQINIVSHFSDDPFVRLPRATARDQALGWRALGMLTFMRSLPRDWVFRLSHLSCRRDGHGNGRYAVRAALSEMEAGGYLEIKRTRGEDGRINGVEWHIADKPIFPRKSPCSGFQTVENPKSENQALHKNDFTEEDKEAAARKALEAPSADAAAAIPSSLDSKPKPTPSPRRRIGDEEVVHGVEVWTDQDEAAVADLVQQHGAEAVESAAAATAPARGHRAPYRSAVAATLEARARADKVSGAGAPPPPPAPREVGHARAMAARTLLAGGGSRPTIPSRQGVEA